ncbi:TPA: metal-sensing transcriptional repressor, partial [Staphylococcus aureus]|nr:metal-sensing transcriptional repressor [Staphylococcus aureus]HDI7086048.1 metal-sensing transcriptional repressor [Staphylococcus aureus]HDI7110299.1 metal-sensing transcriptional repressor [Staphylococcus aureus]
MTYDKKMINRINRIQGQLNGVVKMMEEEKDCKDIITQLRVKSRLLCKMLYNV